MMCSTAINDPQSSSSSSSYSGSSKGRIAAVVAAAVSLLLLLSLAAAVATTIGVKSDWKNGLVSSAINDALPTPHRKLIQTPKTRVDKPDRFWGDTKKCTNSDLILTQGLGSPLPSGIPTYTVEIVNACMTGCDITQIHFRCGWFSSARLINPQIFKRVKYDDCLVNGGQPLQNGQTISFQYANTYSYPLSISSMTCL